MTRRIGWRRFGAPALAVVLAAVLPLTAQAAPALPHSRAWLTSTATLKSAPASLHTASLLRGLSAHALRPQLRTFSSLQTVTDPTKLAFTPPTGALKPTAGTADTTFADDSTKNAFASLDNATYASAGMQSGYAEFFSLPIGTGTDTVDIEYLATIYGTAAQAAARVTSVQKYLTGKGLTAQSCGTSCALFGLQFPDSTGRAIDLNYVIWSNDNVVAELAFIVPDDTLNANNAAFLAIVESVSTLAIAVVPIQQAAAGPLTIVSFTLAHAVKNTAKVTKKLKSGELGAFVADIQFPTAGDTVQAQVTFTVGKKTVGPLILGSPENVSTTEVVVGATHKFKVKKTTSVVAHLQVQDGTAQVTQDLKFKVTP